MKKYIFFIAAVGTIAHATGQTNISLEDEYFRQVKNNPSWIESRKNLIYTENDHRSSHPSRFEEDSEQIKKVIEQTYSVKVPFNTSLAYRLNGRKPVFEYQKGKLFQPSYLMRQDGESYCEALTVTLLSSLVTSVTLQHGFSEVFGKEHSPNSYDWKNEEEVLLGVLTSYCKDAGKSEFIDPVKSFLSKYSTIIQEAVIAKREESRRIAEKEKRLKAEEMERQRVADLEKKRLETERVYRERKKEEELQKENQKILAYQEKLRRELIEQKEAEQKKAFAQHLSELRSGQRPVKNISDAALLFTPQNDISVVISPPLTPDNLAYRLYGKLIKKEGAIYIFELSRRPDMYYFFIQTSHKTIFPEKTVLRYNYPFMLIGKFTNLKEYHTIGGETKIAPVFDAMYIGSE